MAAVILCGHLRNLLRVDCENNNDDTLHFCFPREASRRRRRRQLVLSQNSTVKARARAPPPLLVAVALPGWLAIAI